MKVIFIEDVPNVARAGDTKEVADGYGRNFLLPQKYAVMADAKSLAAVESKLKKIAEKRAKEEAEMAETAQKISGMEVTIKATAGSKNKLYGSVTSAAIAEELGKMDINVDKRKIELAEPIRQLGSHDVNIRFTHEITASIKVTVIADKVVEEEEKVEEAQVAEVAAEPEKKEKKKAKAKAAEEAEPEAKEEPVEAKAEKKTRKKKTEEAAE